MSVINTVFVHQARLSQPLAIHQSFLTPLSPSQHLQHLDRAISTIDSLPVTQQQDLAKSLLLMIQIYYDLNSQDIPEFFEDHLSEFMNLFHKYLTWHTPALLPDPAADDELDTEAGLLEKIRASICEVVELYSQRYLDVFPMMGSFAETCWAMLTGLGPQQRYDIVSQFHVLCL